MPELIPVDPGSPEWHATRRTGITSTDIATILGLNPWDSAYALYYRKLGLIPEIPDNDRFRLSRDLEPLIAARWIEANAGAWAIPDTTIGLFRSSDRSWQMASLDRLAGPYLSSPDEVLELKSSATRDGWGDTGTTNIPPHVRAQLLWRMDVMGIATGHVGCLFLPGGEFRHYTLAHNHTGWRDEATGLMSGIGSLACDLCTDLDMMRIAGAAFLNILTDPNLPAPSVDESATTTATLKALHAHPARDKRAEVDPIVWQHYKRARESIESYKAQKDEAENLIREQIAEAGIITVNGETVAYRRRYIVKAHYRKTSNRDMIICAIPTEGTETDD